MKILIPSLNFLPPGSSKTKFPPQEASVISVPTNRQVRLTAILWSKKSSAYKLLKVSRVINDFKIALNKVKYSKNLFLKLLLNQYHFQNYFCDAILSSPLPDAEEFDSPPKEFLPCLWKFQNFFPTLNLGWERHYVHPWRGRSVLSFAYWWLSLYNKLYFKVFLNLSKESYSRDLLIYQILPPVTDFLKNIFKYILWRLPMHVFGSLE